jgi:predicted Zn-dependent protease
MHLERPAEAVAAYDQTEKLAPGWFNTRAERWVAAEVAAGRLDQAIFFILRTEDMPDSAAGWDQKLSLVDQAITRAGDIPPLLLYRARCLMRMGRAAEAEPVVRAALEKATEPDVRTRLLVDLQMLSPDVQEKKRLLAEAVALSGNIAAAGVARVAQRQMVGLNEEIAKTQATAPRDKM